MKTYYLHDTKNKNRLTQHPDSSSGLPARWELPDGRIPPTLERMAYLKVVSKPNFDPATQVCERFDDYEALTEGWKITDKTAEEIAAEAQAAQAAALDQARSEISNLLLSSLSVESRAKFGGVRAGIETLLDVGDIKAAIKLLQDTPTDNESESTVKSIINNALSQFTE